MKTTHEARINNPDGWRHGETGDVLGIVGDTVQIKFSDGGSSGFPSAMVTISEKKEEAVGRGSVPKAVFVMS